MKKCSKCKQEKPFTEFYKGKKPDGYQNECKTCGKERYKKYYSENKQYYIDRTKDYLQRNREFVERYKKTYGKCVDCGITDWRVLQFDHTRDKLNNVSDLVSTNKAGIKTIKEEIRKCEMRCANCHQIKTYHGGIA